MRAVDEVGRGYSHESLDRAVRVLDAFTGDRPLSLTEIARGAELSDATALRYLTSLCIQGLVERERSSGHYRLGIRLFELGQRALRGRDPRRLAHSYMEGLRDQFEETVNLAMRHGDELVVIEVLESRQSIRKGATVGDKDHWHASSLGKAILAVLPESEVHGLLKRSGQPSLTPKTLTSPRDLVERLQEVRRHGYAIDDEESEENLRCIGAAVFDDRGSAAYALSVAGPKNRLAARRTKEVGEAVRAAAASLSIALGYQTEAEMQ
jgi:IclR family acetate operon transcriptional repressor